MKGQKKSVNKPITKIMPRASGSTFYLPALLDQVFQKYSCNKKSESLGDLFVELNSLLGARVVKAALHLLDYQTIVVYHNPLRTREIAEIRECHTNAADLVRLFPHINYCTCGCFQQVLNTIKTPDSSYTCEHVLALRLALLMKSDRVRFEELPSNKLNLLLPHFLPGDDSGD